MTDSYSLPLNLWELANDMREQETSAEPAEERLSEYREIRAELEEALAEAEGRDLPEEHLKS